MICYIEREAGFMRCEIRDCGPGDGWELFITERREDEDFGGLYADLLEDADARLSLPSQTWR